jgi:predicted aspartyl protease
VFEASVTALVDTGAGTLVIGEEIKKKLGLEVRGLRQAVFANNVKAVCKPTDPVEIRWKNRDTILKALAVPGQKRFFWEFWPLRTWI